jgi:Polyketide cyclase / dehydrase and lipid transport
MKIANPSSRSTVRAPKSAIAIAGACLGMTTASAATLSRSVDVDASPSAVWALIGPFCAIRNWLPPVGTCHEDGGVPPTRTLVTKDGKATFVERETARNEAEFFYSYTFLSSPLPVTAYSSTIRVAARSQGQSTVTWTGSYVPDAGKERDAQAALEDIYAAGLESIRQQVQTIARSSL